MDKDNVELVGMATEKFWCVCVCARWTQGRFKRDLSQSTRKGILYRLLIIKIILNKMRLLNCCMSGEKKKAFSILTFSNVLLFMLSPCHHMSISARINQQNPHWRLLCQCTNSWELGNTLQPPGKENVWKFSYIIVMTCCKLLHVATSLNEACHYLHCIIHITIKTEQWWKNLSKIYKLLMGLDPLPPCSSLQGRSYLCKQKICMSEEDAPSHSLW